MTKAVLLCLAAPLVLLLASCSSTTPKVTSDHAPAKPRDISGITDAVPRPEPYSRYGNPESYVVFGKRYYTRKDSKDYREQGIASWYGLSLIHISEPTRLWSGSRMPSSA